MNRPPCHRDPALFDSTNKWDHLTARETCATCPKVRSCLELAVAISAEYQAAAYRGPDGTWGGLLWVNGSVVPVVVPGALGVAS